MCRVIAGPRGGKMRAAAVRIDNGRVVVNNLPAVRFPRFRGPAFVMILEGVKLMVVGMAIVYVFLVVLMLSVIVSARIFRDDAPPPSSGGAAPGGSRGSAVAVIAAAVAAYRAKGAGDG